MRYANKQIKMEDADPTEFLSALRKRLTDRALPIQEVIAAAIDVDQPFISRAKRGHLSRITPKVIKLDAYLCERAALAKGTTSKTGRTGSMPPKRGRKSGNRQRAKVQQTDQATVKLARRSCEAYLDEGYSPRVLIDQIAILREAQAKRKD